MTFKKYHFLVFTFCFCFLGVKANDDIIENEYPPIISSTCIGDSGKVEWFIYNNLSGFELEKLYNQPSFPQNPDRITELNFIATPPRYNDFYAGMIRGFIKAPETGDYIFNITGDDQSTFKLSTDTFPENLIEVAYSNIFTSETEHTKDTTQTSDTLQLVAGEYYYFEAQYKEGTGNDFVKVFWKRPSTIDDPDWEIIHGGYLFKYDCSIICPDFGTVCDDGDSTTISDIQDGACNCIGTPDTLPFDCIGDRGIINATYFDTINFGLTALYNDADYPLSPNRAEVLPLMAGPLNPGPIDLYGTRIRGYLQIPQTGYYQFNLTGDDQISLLLYENGDTLPPTEIANLPSAVGDYQYDLFPSQTSDSLMLQAGKFYLIEMNHAEGYGGDDFFVSWKTPWVQDSTWRILDAAYMYSYGCEMACIPEGTPCNDGNDNTFNDQYDAFCNCIGTPCSDPECTNSLDYIPYDKCADTDQHSTYEKDSWISCQPSQNPNPIRGLSHWLLYDFGEVYYMNDETQVWNYNVMDSTSLGFGEVVIDYSIDGVTWTELDTFIWNQASGMSDYTGFIFSDLDGVSAQYILLTALSNFDSTECVGISEIAFGANYCVNLSCDDGFEWTINDSFDSTCVCQGELITCTFYNLQMHVIPIKSNIYRAGNDIFSKGEVHQDSIVRFYAGNSITLEPGFVAKPGSDFQALIAPCSLIEGLEEDTPNELIEEILVDETSKEKIIKDNSSSKEIPNFLSPSQGQGKFSLNISPNPSTSWTNIDFNIPRKTKVKLEIFNAAGQLLQIIINDIEMDGGSYQKRIPGQRLAAGVYYISIHTNTGKITERLVVLSL